MVARRWGGIHLNEWIHRLGDPSVLVLVLVDYVGAGQRIGRRDRVVGE